MAKEQGVKPIAQNKKARHDYAIEDKYEAGLVLTGTEVKSLREGRASLAESFITIDRRGEMWLEGANIPEYLNGTWNNHAPKRKRKLLLPCGADRQAGTSKPSQRFHHHSAEPVFQGWPCQGGNCVGSRQEGIRQASGVARGTRQA